MKQTKIIATIGPSSTSESILKYFFKYGVRTTRLNFSHGDHEEQKNKLVLIRKVSEEIKIPISIMLDTKGPEIRTHNFDGKCKVNKDDVIKIYSKKEILGNSSEFSITLKEFCNDIKINDKILVDDGKLQLKCIKIKNDIVYAKALNTHILISRRGVNLPNVILSLPFLSKKDKKDLLFGCENNVDWIAASFVNNAADIASMRKFLDQNGGSKIKICAKLESRLAMENLKVIIKAADAVMVARGDLGIEIPYYEVPAFQIKIISYSLSEEKPVIVATQMLESMITSILPTRAEVNDVYIASCFGADSTMLSGETANGNHPKESVKVMCKILEQENKEKIKNEIIREIQKDNKSTTKNLLDDHSDCIIFRKNNYKEVIRLSSLRLSVSIFVLEENNAINNEYGPIYGAHKLIVDNPNIGETEIRAKLKEIYSFEPNKILIIG